MRLLVLCFILGVAVVIGVPIIIGRLSPDDRPPPMMIIRRR